MRNSKSYRLVSTFILATSVIGAIVIPLHSAHARPEYAVKTSLSCTSCHINPWGGGPRNVYGKVFGSRNLGIGKFSSMDLFSANLRGIGYYPDSPSKESSGVALMEASGSANVPVIEESEKTGEMRAVLTYNMAPLGSGSREAYLRWKPLSVPSPLPTYIMVGKFNAPFGLLTDEHRTYTRMQTNMTLNNFDVGLAASGDVVSSLTYDIALVNDFQSGGLFSSGGTGPTWGAVINLRWMPYFLPLFLGASQNYERLLNRASPFATSLYTAISADRLTSGKASGSILFEYVLAKNWNSASANPNISSFFVPGFDSAYLDAVSASRSAGYYLQIKYDLNPHWVLIYKFDYLALSTDFTGDAFMRHGVGFETFLNSNLILDTRYERGLVQRPEIQNTHILADQNDLIMMLRLWL